MNIPATEAAPDIPDTMIQFLMKGTVTPVTDELSMSCSTGRPAAGLCAGIGRAAVDEGYCRCVASSVPGTGQSKWETFGERAIYENRWVWLGQVEVREPGGERFWHHVVRLPRAAMMVLVDDRSRVLLMWRHRFVADRWGWELPGGLVEDGEDPAQTAARELEEETGWRAGQVEHLITYQPMVGMLDSEHYVFTGRDPVVGSGTASVSEADRIAWVPLSRVPSLIAGGEIWNSGTLVALMRLVMPGGGHAGG
jgi:8-oxo-dGDP phosphatase